MAQETGSRIDDVVTDGQFQYESVSNAWYQSNHKKCNAFWITYVKYYQYTRFDTSISEYSESIAELLSYFQISSNQI